MKTQADHNIVALISSASSREKSAYVALRCQYAEYLQSLARNSMQAMSFAEFARLNKIQEAA